MALSVDDIVRRFEGLSPQDLVRLEEIYTADARFKDPFHAVQGVPAIARVYARMFATLQAPRFVVRDRVVADGQCFLTWDFSFRLQRLGAAEQRIHGGSHLRLAADGRISEHRDYWDAAEELYEKLPLVGALMRWLKARARG
ncbi:MAG: nuclear transport factor 2 family protein [Rubrivivax sp.]|nr:nuclear transport factor 2 family protein [Rubrivivax sp.]